MIKCQRYPLVLTIVTPLSSFLYFSASILPLFHPLVGENSQTDADKSLERHSLEVGEKESLAKDDFCLRELAFHDTLQAVGQHQLQTICLFEQRES